MSEKKFVEKYSEFFENLNNDFIKNSIVFDEISSTNEIAKEHAVKGESEGTIILSRVQKQGRGRYNRVWESPDGGVYISIIIRPNCPPEKSMLLSLMVSIIISRTLSNYHIFPAIKWPNDVLIKGKKIAGILIESESDQSHLKYVVVGIGINVNVNIKNLSKKIREKSTSLLVETNKEVKYYEFLNKLLITFNKYYKKFLSKEYDLIIQEWKTLSNTIGQRVMINQSSNPLTGKVIDIDKTGSLIIKISKNKYKKISSGELIYL